MIKASVTKKPLFLDLDHSAKQDYLAKIQSSSLSGKQSSATCEALLFLEEVEHRLKSPNITVKKMRALFALKSELLKKILPA
jgi:hypothetical protein